MKFNLNRLIGVDLTIHGFKRYKSRTGSTPIYSADGLVYLPGWQIFSMFGDMIWHGNPNLPFSMDVVVTVPEKEIKDA